MLELFFWCISDVSRWLKLGEINDIQWSNSSLFRFDSAHGSPKDPKSKAGMTSLRAVLLSQKLRDMGPLHSDSEHVFQFLLYSHYCIVISSYIHYNPLYTCCHDLSCDLIILIWCNWRLYHVVPIGLQNNEAWRCRWVLSMSCRPWEPSQSIWQLRQREPMDPMEIDGNLSNPIGSMYGILMLTWLGYIDGIHVTIYTSTMDPMGIEKDGSLICFVLWAILTMNWNRKGSSRVAATRITNGQLRDVNRRRTTSLQRERRHRTRRTWNPQRLFKSDRAWEDKMLFICCLFRQIWRRSIPYIYPCLFIFIHGLLWCFYHRWIVVIGLYIIYIYTMLSGHPHIFTYIFDVIIVYI